MKSINRSIKINKKIIIIQITIEINQLKKSFK